MADLLEPFAFFGAFVAWMVVMCTVMFRPDRIRALVERISPPVSSKQEGASENGSLPQTEISVSASATWSRRWTHFCVMAVFVTYYGTFLYLFLSLVFVAHMHRVGAIVVSAAVLGVCAIVPTIPYAKGEGTRYLRGAAGVTLRAGLCYVSSRVPLFMTFGFGEAVRSSRHRLRRAWIRNECEGVGDSGGRDDE